MAQEAFARDVQVRGAPAEVWETITDVDRLISWVSILEDARTIEELSHYQAMLADRLGMFSLRADLDVTVDAYKEPVWLRASAAGEDRQVGSRITVELELRLDGAGEGTELRVSGSYGVTGRVATLGASTIRRKADKVLQEFFSNLEAELG